MNGSLPTNAKVSLSHYEVDDIDGLIGLFRSFDTKKSARSTDDVSAVCQHSQPALRQVPNDNARLSVEGYAWYRSVVMQEVSVKGDGRFQFFCQEAFTVHHLGRRVSVR